MLFKRVACSKCTIQWDCMQSSSLCRIENKTMCLEFLYCEDGRTRNKEIRFKMSGKEKGNPGLLSWKFLLHLEKIPETLLPV